ATGLPIAHARQPARSLHRNDRVTRRDARAHPEPLLLERHTPPARRLHGRDVDPRVRATRDRGDRVARPAPAGARPRPARDDQSLRAAGQPERVGGGVPPHGVPPQAHLPQPLRARRERALCRARGRLRGRRVHGRGSKRRPRRCERVRHLRRRVRLRRVRARRRRRRRRRRVHSLDRLRLRHALRRRERPRLLARQRAEVQPHHARRVGRDVPGRAPAPLRAVRGALVHRRARGRPRGAAAGDGGRVPSDRVRGRG
ncbi:hypothetical protein HETIRDRAFT_435125, partial [Heterobasidion irregulare TC 32-1]